VLCDLDLRFGEVTMVNKVILVGRLGKDPELRTTPNGRQVCRFSVATDSGFGEQRKTEWHNVVTFERQAENCAKFLRKGSMVYVDGRITYGKYEKDGQTRYSTDIIASSVQFLSTKGETASGGNFGSGVEMYDSPAYGGDFGGGGGSSSSSEPASPEFGGGFNDEEIPF